MCTRPMTKFVDPKIICVKSRLLLLFRAAFQRVAVTVFRWRKRMRTCPHMSPGCSSPRDLNIAPARHYCCHSQTHSDLLTSPAQKRLDADTFTANVFHQCKKEDRREREWEGEGERKMSASVQCEDVSCCSLFPPKHGLTFAAIDWRQADDRLAHRSDSWTFLNTWCAARGQGSEFDGHLLVCYRWACETLVLQAAARPRVGSVRLHNAHFPLPLSHLTALF